MNNEEILKRIEVLERDVSRIKAYFKWTLIIAVALFVLPLIGLLFAIPVYLKTINSLSAF